MTVECVDCDRFTLRDAPMAKNGFGKCALRPAHEGHSAVYPRERDRFTPAPADKVEQRRAWLKKRDEALAALVAENRAS